MSTTFNSSTTAAPITTTKPKPKSSEVEVEAVAVVANTNCAVCSVEPFSTSITKDLNFTKLLGFYYEALQVDIKPAEIAKQSVCVPCFESLVEFYDTNDVLVILEKQLTSLRRGLINTTVAGIKKLAKDDKPLSGLHKRVLEKWPVVKEEADEPSAKDQDQNKSIKTYLEEPKTSKHSADKKTTATNNGNTGSDKGRKVVSPLSKSSASTSSSEVLRKRKRLSSTESPSKSKAAAVSTRPTRSNRNTAPVIDGEDSDTSATTEEYVQNGDAENDEEEKDDPNKCKICLDTFPNGLAFKHHMKDHTTVKNKFQCRICKKTYIKASELIEHKKGCQLPRR